MFSAYLFIYVCSYFSSSPLAASSGETFLIRGPRDSGGEETRGISGRFRIPMKNTRFCYVLTRQRLVERFRRRTAAHRALGLWKVSSSRWEHDQAIHRRYVPCISKRSSVNVDSRAYANWNTYARTCINTHDEDVALARARTVFCTVLAAHIYVKRPYTRDTYFDTTKVSILKMKYQ